jgi:hypothetical protein
MTSEVVNLATLKVMSGVQDCRHPTLKDQLMRDSMPRTLTSKLGHRLLVQPAKNLLNKIDHTFGWDKSRLDEWMANQGPHSITQASLPMLLHETSFWKSLRRNTKREYMDCYARHDTAAFWTSDHRAAWRCQRTEKVSTSEMFFTVYLTNATYLGTKYHNPHRSSTYFLACDDIVNFFVNLELADLPPKQLRARCWKRWGLGHNFNVPIEIELPLVRNCIEAAILTIMALTQADEFAPNQCVLQMYNDESSFETLTTPYVPRFRSMQEDTPLESMMSSVHNSTIQIPTNADLDEREAIETLVTKDQFVTDSAEARAQAQEAVVQGIPPALLRRARQLDNEFNRGDENADVAAFPRENQSDDSTDDEDDDDSVFPTNVCGDNDNNDNDFVDNQPRLPLHSRVHGGGPSDSKK